MAARAAISSPLLDLSMEGARGVLFNIAGGNDLTMFEVNEAAKIISQSADADANIIFGAVVKNDLNDQVKITVIATGFDETQSRLASFSKVGNETKIEGIISETLKTSKEEEETQEEEEMKEFPQASDEDSDIFGQKFEIPAFLRKIH
jgi:cell division protein FtsZ